MPDDMSFFMESRRKYKAQTIKKEKSHVTLLIPIGIELARTAGGYQLVKSLYMTERMFVKANRAFLLITFALR